MHEKHTPIISIIGWHNVGKTTFVTRLIIALKRRGLRVATIKHTRGDFQLDHEGTDTWRYAQAGSDIIAIAGRGQVAVLEQGVGEPRLADIVARLPASLDLIITEGYKEAPTPKIEIVASCDERKRIARSGELVAQVVGVAESEDGGESPGGRHAAQRTDVGGNDVPPGTPCFRMDEVEAIIDLLAARGFLRGRGASK